MKLMIFFKRYKNQINNVLIIIAITLIILFSIIPIIYYRCHLGTNFSQINSDWGDFGDYFNGVVSPFLSLVNIIVLIWLTKTASGFNKSSFEKQLAHNTCAEYQGKINSFMFEFFDNIDLIAENQNEQEKSKYRKRAFHRLERIRYLATAFIDEATPFLSEKSNLQQIQNSKNELIKTIDLILQGNTDSKTFDVFFEKKSAFINTVYKSLKLA